MRHSTELPFRIALALLTCVAAGCGKKPHSIALCNLGEIANKSPAVIDNALGQPTRTLPIQNAPSMMPGEYRDYSLADDSRVRVRFHRMHAVSFTVQLAAPVASPEQALRRVGIDPEGLTIMERVGESKTWSGKIGNVAFESIRAATDPHNVRDWETVEIRVMPKER